jgi:hypothetical protein
VSEVRNRKETDNEEQEHNDEGARYRCSHCVCGRGSEYACEEENRHAPEEDGDYSWLPNDPVE